MAQDWSETHEKLRDVLFLTVVFCLLSLSTRSCIFQTLSCFFQAQAAIRKWPGSVFSDVLGAIPGSLAEVEDGFALA